MHFVGENDRNLAVHTAGSREVTIALPQLSAKSHEAPILRTGNHRTSPCVTQSPLRVDFAGGWLDCPQYARANAYIVNCAISPLVTLDQLAASSRVGTGLGVSAARWLLLGKDPVAEELAMGVGWQDPAIILRTGLCVWLSGPQPALNSKIPPQLLGLDGTMALLWTETREMSSAIIRRNPRDLELIRIAGLLAREAVMQRSRRLLFDAIHLSYQAQLSEGMAPLPEYGEKAKKYCGAGFGGMAVYLFDDRRARDRFLATVGESHGIEPYFLPD